MKSLGLLHWRAFVKGLYSRQSNLNDKMTRVQIPPMRGMERGHMEQVTRRQKKSLSIKFSIENGNQKVV